jgi:hypothetical protein
MIPQAYLLPYAWPAARERLAMLEAALDPGTMRHLNDLGVGPGWRCWSSAAAAASLRGSPRAWERADGSWPPTSGPRLSDNTAETAGSDHPSISEIA